MKYAIQVTAEHIERHSVLDPAFCMLARAITENTPFYASTAPDSILLTWKFPHALRALHLHAPQAIVIPMPKPLWEKVLTRQMGAQVDPFTFILNTSKSGGRMDLVAWTLDGRMADAA